MMTLDPPTKPHSSLVLNTQPRLSARREYSAVWLTYESREENLSVVVVTRSPRPLYSFVRLKDGVHEGRARIFSLFRSYLYSPLFSASAQSAGAFRRNLSALSGAVQSSATLPTGLVIGQSGKFNR